MCIALGRRSIIEKHYYYPPNFRKNLYGENLLEYPINFLYVVEGPFNLWSLKQWGKQGVALLGTGTSKQYEDLKEVVTNGYVLALDPDEAGRYGTLKIIKYLTANNKFNIYVADIEEGKDINDLSYEEFRNTEVLHYKEWQQKYKIFS